MANQASDVQDNGAARKTHKTTGPVKPRPKYLQRVTNVPKLCLGRIVSPIRRGLS